MNTHPSEDRKHPSTPVRMTLAPTRAPASPLRRRTPILRPRKCSDTGRHKATISAPLRNRIIESREGSREAHLQGLVASRRPSPACHPVPWMVREALDRRIPILSAETNHPDQRWSITQKGPVSSHSAMTIVSGWSESVERRWSFEKETDVSEHTREARPAEAASHRTLPNIDKSLPGDSRPLSAALPSYGTRAILVTFATLETAETCESLHHGSGLDLSNHGRRTILLDSIPDTTSNPRVQAHHTRLTRLQRMPKLTIGIRPFPTRPPRRCRRHRKISRMSLLTADDLTPFTPEAHPTGTGDLWRRALRPHQLPTTRPHFTIPRGTDWEKITRHRVTAATCWRYRRLIAKAESHPCPRPYRVPSLS